MSKKMIWGFCSLIIGLIGVIAVLLIRDRDTEPIKIYKVPDIATQDVKKVVLKPPPDGETYATGHWHGDEWHRTVPPEPEAVSVDGEMWTYADLERKIMHGPPEDRRKANLRLIEAYPYSELALEARYDFTKYDKNNKRIPWGSRNELPQYKEMLKYHPDSPRLLQDLAQLTQADSPEESIVYAKEALKYVDLYASNSWYGLWTEPEEIHTNLGMAYQRVGDYDSALVHLKAAQTLVNANPGRYWENDDTIVAHIEAIERGFPVYGPPSEVEAFDESLSDPFNLPLLPDFPVDTSPDADVDGAFDPQAMPVDTVSAPGGSPAADAPRAVAAQQMRDAFVQRQQQEFEDFLQWMETIENAKSPADLEDFLMREMAKQLRGESPDFSSDRLIRAFETMQRHGKTDAIPHLQKIDPDLAKAMSKQRSQRPRRTTK